jgi:RNA polymerase sigma-70 factor, ECF subfamily
MAFSRQLRLELYSATLALLKKHEQKTVFAAPLSKKRNRIPVSSIVSAGIGRHRRPSPQRLRLLPLLGKLHQTRSWLNRSPLAANQRCRLCSRGIGPTSTRWLLRFVSNETLAEDLLSEVFLDVWRHANRFQYRSSVSTWLMSIARHKALSARRRRTEGAELDEKIEATIADPANDPEVALQEKDRGELVRRALMRLSPEHREVIDLVYYHEKSVEEVAHILDVPPATVKTRMFYARKKLADLINGPEKVRR